MLIKLCTILIVPPTKRRCTLNRTYRERNFKFSSLVRHGAVVHILLFTIKAYIPVYPLSLWQMRWVYAVKNTIGWYTAYTRVYPPKYTHGNNDNLLLKWQAKDGYGLSDGETPRTRGADYKFTIGLYVNVSGRQLVVAVTSHFAVSHFAVSHFLGIWVRLQLRVRSGFRDGVRG